jgi:hypothetical protein
LTATEQIIAVLRDCGAANVWYDDSAADGCPQVDTSDAWFQGVAEAIVDALRLPVEGPYCPRCGARNAPLPVSGVCGPCAKAEGWSA